MRITRRLAATAATVALALAAAACGANSVASGPKGHPVRGGTVTIGWPATPNFVFPLPPATNTDGFNANLTELMWPYIVYAGYGAKSVVNPQESLFSSLKYSNGDKTLTIVLKPWKWSDGTPITSRDFTFVYDLLKVNYKNWNGYLGQFPTNVTSVSTPDSHTAVLNFDRSYNPAFYTDDVLSLVPLLPQHAWDKTSMTGAVGNYDETAGGAKAVYAFLQKEGGQMGTFTTSPLWKVVDGPWQLSQFVPSSGLYSYVPNKNYSGPVKPHLSKVVNEPFTSDTALVNSLLSGSLDVGTLPNNDIKQIPRLKSLGYSVAVQPIPGVAEIIPNLYNATVGGLLRQLYIRQAMEDLINRPQIVSKVYNGYADPGNGPVPVQAFGPWVSPLEKSGGPYPYSPSNAVSLLKAHGWKVEPTGVSTCQHAGNGPADCGAGIAASQPLSFQYLYSSGSATMDEQEAAIQSSEAQAGIRLNLKPEPFNTMISQVGTCTASSHPAATCGWQLADFGYDPYPLYPNGAGFFNPGGINNNGGYSDTQMNNMINATVYGSSTQAFFAYEDYAARQLPWLWLPQPSFLQMYKTNLQGYAPLNPFSGGLDPEAWYYTR